MYIYIYIYIDLYLYISYSRSDMYHTCIIYVSYMYHITALFGDRPGCATRRSTRACSRGRRRLPYMCVYIYIYIRTHIHTYVCRCMYACVCMYIDIYMYIPARWDGVRRSLPRVPSSFASLSPLSLSLFMCIYIYIYIYIHTHIFLVYLYTHTYIHNILYTDVLQHINQMCNHHRIYQISISTTYAQRCCRSAVTMCQHSVGCLGTRVYGMVYNNAQRIIKHLRAT